MVQLEEFNNNTLVFKSPIHVPFPQLFQKASQSVGLDEDPEESLASAFPGRCTFCFLGPCPASAGSAFKPFCAPARSVAP